MARIRSIKPEFPQSETVGRLSRDARLLFIQLWTIVDDLGRARAASRMLASLLYPYDDDVPGLIDGWLEELELEHCLIRYEVEGTTYLQLTNWLKHQKIDHPSASKHPAPQPILANPREPSLILAPRARAPDLGPRIGKGSPLPNGKGSNGKAHAIDNSEPAGSGAGAPLKSIPIPVPKDDADKSAYFKRGREILEDRPDAGRVLSAILKNNHKNVSAARLAMERVACAVSPWDYANRLANGAPKRDDDEEARRRKGECF